jgi:hypothetical protein
MMVMATIQLDEEQAIAVRETHTTAHLALQPGQSDVEVPHSLLQVGSST